MSFNKIRTACDVLAEAKRKYSRPATLTKDEVDDLADELYEMVQEIHAMADSMEARLNEYHDFTEKLRDDATSLLSS